MMDYGVIDTLGDDPNRVGSPDENPFAPPVCDVCGEHLQAPFIDCDGYYICSSCAKDNLYNTRHAPGWFVSHLQLKIQDLYEYTLPTLGDMD